MSASLVGSEMCIRDSFPSPPRCGGPCGRRGSDDATFVSWSSLWQSAPRERGATCRDPLFSTGA
eukprot:10467101-Alexandrium_andersonii.AAC.1